MTEFAVSGTGATDRAGAPLRALSILAACWVLGRILWECLHLKPLAVPLTHASVDQNMTAITSRSTSRPGLPAQPIPFFIDPVAQWPERSDDTIPKLRAALNRSSEEGSGNYRATKFKGLAVLLPDATSGFFRFPEHHDHSPSAGLRTSRQISDRIANHDSVSEETDHRLSGYFWFFLRQDSDGEQPRRELTAPQPLGGQYGGSQAGGNLTYRLVNDRNRNLSIFGRVSTAISSPNQEEGAIGAKFKPVGHIPISLFAEQRFGAADDHLRGTAVYVAGGTGPDQVIGDFAVETYAQAGYVFGEANSYFFDGSAVIDHDILKLGPGKFSIGAGAWTGGQQGAARLDIGPRARIDVPTGRLMTRLTVDWRGRVSGKARPDSGVAISLTTGF